MKTLLMLSAVLAQLLTSSFCASAKENTYISIETLMKENKLKAGIKNAGAHSAFLMAFALENLTGKTLYILIEPGRRLIAKDSALQDIFIVSSKKIILEGRASKTIKTSGYCCESNDRGPQAGNIYSIGYMAPDPWVRLARMIDTNNFDDDAVQSAVWCLSNDHDLSSISNEPRNLALRQTVAAIKNVPVPWHRTTYSRDTSRVFSGEAASISGIIDYHLRSNAMITVIIASKKGEIRIPLWEKAAMGPGAHTYYFEVEVKGWPKGEYEVSIYEDGGILNTRKTFLL